MPTVDKINEYVAKMPDLYQAEVLSYVEYLWGKLNVKEQDKDDLQWQEMSLASALRDLNEADEVSYSMDDLKEKF